MKVDIAIITVREDEYEAVLQRFKPTPYRRSWRTNVLASATLRQKERVLTQLQLLAVASKEMMLLNDLLMI